MELYPSICNLCGGEVIYTSNAKIYGREYGSGMMYFCIKCGAYVGTHEPRPKEALGLLANAQMRSMKRVCHDIFDEQWKYEKDAKRRHIARRKAYRVLASSLNIPVNECHFGYFDMDMLEKAYQILTGKDK